MASKIELDTKEEISLQYPKNYKVFLLNDDYTSMEFVIEILMKLFHKTYNQAEDIMLSVHKKGKGLCGIYTYEIAQTKVEQVIKRARDNNYPLKAVMEEE